MVTAILRKVPQTAEEMKPYEELYNKIAEYSARNIEYIWPKDRGLMWEDEYECAGEIMNCYVHRDQFDPENGVIDLEKYPTKDCLYGFTPFGRCNILVGAFCLDNAWLTNFINEARALDIELSSPVSNPA